MKATPTRLSDVLLLEPAVFRDERGWFMETYNAATMERLGLPTEFVQDNHSHSSRGVVRGLHYQLVQPQGKLLRCTRGRILDVAVDIRRSSRSFGQWMSAELSEDNFHMLWIPPGFAHGFAVLSESAEVVYKCTTFWQKPSDRTLLWNDLELGIEWGITDPIISEKDQKGARLREAEVFD